MYTKKVQKKRKVKLQYKMTSDKMKGMQNIMNKTKGKVNMKYHHINCFKKSDWNCAKKCGGAK